MTVRSMALLVLISVVFFVLFRITVGDPPSSDLRALWLAGVFFPSGDPSLVYAVSDGVFSMEPPDIWIETVRAEGIDAPVYPFIYPPLWAWVMSWVVPLTTMQGFAHAFAILNPCLIILSALLAMRIALPSFPRPVFFAVSLGIALTGIVFLLALAENQPQILVTFLILLGIERVRFGSPVAGGLAMALAASIKLYPVIFALIWLASGEKRATAVFAIFGGALGVCSLALAGWPLHAVFLSELSAISNTIFMSRANFSLDPLLGTVLLAQSEITMVDTALSGGDTNWLYASKSAVWQMASTVVQLATLALLLFMARRTKMADPLLWPFVFIAVAWVSPLSWLYHYMAMFLFLPALFDRLGRNAALILLVLILAPTNYALFNLGVFTGIEVPANNAALVLAGGLFLWLGLRDKGEHYQPG